jgi:hypothetical protein
VLARPDRPDLRDRLNLVLKRRVWYQPFCPTMLEGDAARLLADWDGGSNTCMTMAYEVSPRFRNCLAGVISVNGTCRPQVVREDEPGEFADLLREARVRWGAGVVLNTSFNIHGEPMVCSPEEAIDVFVRSGADALAMGPFLLNALDRPRLARTVARRMARARGGMDRGGDGAPHISDHAVALLRGQLLYGSSGRSGRSFRWRPRRSRRNWHVLGTKGFGRRCAIDRGGCRSDGRHGAADEPRVLRRAHLSEHRTEPGRLETGADVQRRDDSTGRLVCALGEYNKQPRALHAQPFLLVFGVSGRP